VLILALGIGSTTAIFSIASSVLLDERSGRGRLQSVLQAAGRQESRLKR
jgi:hypothetical protein